MLIPEWGSVLNGKHINSKAAHVYRPTAEDNKRWAQYILSDERAISGLNALDDSREFFKCNPDLALLIPTAERTEAFYSMKNGFTVANVPAAFIFHAQRLYKQHKAANIILPAMSSKLQAQVGSKDYFGVGYTATDVIREFVCPSFEPITNDRWRVRCDDHFENYAPNLDAVIITRDNRFTDTDLEHIMLKDTIVTLYGDQLTCMSPTGVYDLR